MSVAVGQTPETAPPVFLVEHRIRSFEAPVLSHVFPQLQGV